MLDKDGVTPYSHVAQGDTGILLIHGYTGAPGVMKPQREYFAKAGFHVEVPLLPGHGTELEEMYHIKYRVWLKCVEEALLKLKERCTNVFIMGLSMGGALTLYLAEKFDFIRGIILVNNTLYVEEFRVHFAWLVRYFCKNIACIGNDIKAPGITEPAYDRNPVNGVYQMHRMLKLIRKNIKEIKCPVVIFKSTEDHVISVRVAEYTYKHIGSEHKKLIYLHDSYHVATLDYDKEVINRVSLQFIRDILDEK